MRIRDFFRRREQAEEGGINNVLDTFDVEFFAYRCTCGGRVCICGEDGYGWAAHCMDCDISIGKMGYYDPCAKTEYEACRLWNELIKLRRK